MPSILSDLNPAQQEAVTHGTGPLLILAGAGSGKTRALTYRAAYLILEKQVAPESILLLTFTNKAAGEMKDRIKSLITNHSITNSLPFAGTFHSFCAKILRKEGSLLGIPPNYVIYDETDQLEAVKEALTKLGLSPTDFKPSPVLKTISQAKNELISELEYPQYCRSPWQKTVARVYLEYQKLLSESLALDFDDLIFKIVGLLKNFPEALGKYQNLYPYLLIDEYQDTNYAQYVLTKLLAGRYRNLTVVGDASQCIYGWRGANFRNLVNLKTDFPNLKIVNLEQNYRSTQTILDTAYSVICRNTSHPVLKLWTKNDQGDKVFLCEVGSEVGEAEFVVNQITRLTDKYRFSDFVVLYRTNAQSRVLEEFFLHAGIPYILVGSIRFYQRKEIKDVLAYLRVLANPRDIISLKRIEKLGKSRLKKFLDWQAVKTKDTLSLLDGVLEVTDYLSLYDPTVEGDLVRLENIKELRSAATQFPKLTDFLENVSLIEREELADKPLLPRREAVTLMTLHAAKGLEFPVVFMVGMEEGLFPLSHCLLDQSELEEERRLCYVGITRAKEKLFLVYAKKRLFFGQHSRNSVSRFISDIPEKLLKKVSEFEY